jgi:hypothetical protein
MRQKRIRLVQSNPLSSSVQLLDGEMLHEDSHVLFEIVGLHLFGHLVSFLRKQAAGDESQSDGSDDPDGHHESSKDVFHCLSP